MRGRSFLLAAVLPCAAVLAHCGSDEVGGGEPDAGVVDGGGDVTTSEGGEGGSTSPFGLDTRPANPTCKAPARPPSGTFAKVERAFASLPQLVDPVAIQKVPAKNKWWVVERTGRILSFDAVPTVSTFSTVLDYRPNVESLYLEGGMIGLAFHPKFTSNGFVYVHYTRNAGITNFGSRISRFKSNDGGLTLDPASEKILLDINRTVAVHLGGHVAFGPDGYLYFGLGDESYRKEAQDTSDRPCEDTNCNAILGKVLRIDVDNGDPYAIPPTNPFAGGGGRKEIWAWGLRNPWRFTFDRATGDLWLGDVGEDDYEEIDRIFPGGNYGWPNLEGMLCLTPGNCEGKGFVDPVLVVKHPESLAIVVGPVYRGTKIPGLVGSLLYGDQVNGTQWALSADPATGAPKPIVLNPSGPPSYVTSYGEDTDGEVYMVDYAGLLYTITPAAAAPASPFPDKLSATGCVDPSDPKKPAPGVIPYGVVAPFWSDGADKDRFFALPDGAKITVGADGDLDLPIGSVTMKTFSIGGKRVETRLFIRHTDGDWAGYSYEWNDAQTDATLLPAGKVKTVGATTWTFPSRSECLRCHTKAAGGTLGLELAQLARPFDYPDRPLRDQLATLGHIDLFTAPLPGSVTPLPAPDGTSPVEGRARAYLHANCSFCHRPDGGTSAQMDLRFATPLSGTKTCNVAPLRGDLGIAGASLVKPGNPNASLLSRRMHRTDFARMPPVAVKTVDPKGTATVDAWISGLTACP
ncbi:MAG: PQQ-dependent sugar dehydrogenase [Deltaproteobacteria bacterium]|nr:PQQ-dependent sugar dehydrogenase [Deltaproteobacteria bacterium]